MLLWTIMLPPWFAKTTCSPPSITPVPCSYWKKLIWKRWCTFSLLLIILPPNRVHLMTYPRAPTSDPTTTLILATLRIVVGIVVTTAVLVVAAHGDLLLGSSSSHNNNTPLPEVGLDSATVGNAYVPVSYLLADSPICSSLATEHSRLASSGLRCHTFTNTH